MSALALRRRRARTRRRKPVPRWKMLLAAAMLFVAVGVVANVVSVFAPRGPVDFVVSAFNAWLELFVLRHGWRVVVDPEIEQFPRAAIFAWLDSPRGNVIQVACVGIVALSVSAHVLGIR